MPQQTISALDAFIRHQIYVEGYKNNQVNEANKVLDEIITLISLMLLKTGKTSIGEFTRRELTQFVNDFSSRYSILTGNKEKLSVKELRKFFDADFGIVNYLFKKLGGKTYNGPAAARLWASLQNTPTPGVGDETKFLFRTFFNSAKTRIVKIIKQSYADNLSITDTVKLIAGTKSAKYKDGLVRTLGNQLSATIQTYVQQLTSYLLYKIGGSLYETYQWIAILDLSTTEICRHRDGNIYRYGDGPRPPAHYRCRSTIIPVIISDVVKDVPTFFNWLLVQPVAFQNDVLGTSKGVALRAGKISADELPQFGGMSGLTLEEFKGKRNEMLTPTMEAA